MAIFTEAGKAKIKKWWADVTYVSPEEQERRKVAKEMKEARERAAARYAEDARMLYDAFIDEGFTEEEALELTKGMQIVNEEEE